MKPHNDETVLTAEQVRELVLELIQEERKDAERSLTKAEFCKLERMSLATYHKLKNAGFGPEEVRFPGMAFARITPQGRREWHEKIKQLQNNEALKIEAERRSAQTREAGKSGAASPRHVSRRPRAAAAAKKKKAVRR
jgi:hypothetical protein